MDLLRRKNRLNTSLAADWDLLDARSTGNALFLEQIITYEIINIFQGQKAADEFEFRRELGHEPTETDRWIAAGGA